MAIFVADGNAKVHIKMLGLQADSPLHEQADRIPFHLETGSLKGCGSILNGRRSVTDAYRNVK